MTFVDTSAFYAILDLDDQNHEKAAATWLRLLESKERLLTTNYIVLECCALTQKRLGLKAVRAFQEVMLPMTILHWIDQALHVLAMNVFLAANRSKLSLVDCSSFVVMRQLELQTAFAFDRHFSQEGFVFAA